MMLDIRNKVTALNSLTLMFHTTMELIIVIIKLRSEVKPIVNNGDVIEHGN